MTISSSTRKAGPFTGNGVTVAFPFTFKVFSTADLYVVQADSSGTETVKTLTTDYTVSLNADQNATPGGTVTMLSAPATGYTLTLTSNVAQTQSVDLQNNGGFYPSVINTALDKLTVLIQQMQTYLTGALKLPVSASGVSATLPAPVANKILGWNSTASAIANMEPSSLASLVAYGSTAIDTFTGTGSQTAFTLTQNPSSQNNLGVFLNGLGLTPGVDFTWNSSAPLVLTMTTAPTLADELVVRYQVAMAQGSGTSDAITYTPSGTGAVVSTVQTKLRESVSVKDFGAKGDGVTDDTAAIGLASTAANGRSLYFPSGTYLTTGITFTASNGILIRGDGIGKTIIKLASGSVAANVFSSTSNNVQIRDMTIDGNRAGQSGTGLTSIIGINLGDPTISGATITGVQVSGVRVTGVTQQGIKIFRAKGAVVTNNVLDDFGNASAGVGIFFFRGCTYGVISGNVLTGNASYAAFGIDLDDRSTDSNTSEPCRYNIISNNTIDCVGMTGGIVAEGSSSNTITGNVVNNPGKWGILLNASDASSVPNNQSNYCVVSNNFVTGGVSLSTVDWSALRITGCSYCTVTGNNFNNNVCKGIVLTQGSDTSIPTGNNIVGNTLLNNHIGVLVLSGSQNAISDNTIGSTVAGGAGYYGISIAGSVTAINQTKITGNSVLFAGDNCVSVDGNTFGVTDTVIVSNFMRNGNTRGINVIKGTVACDGVFVRDNYVKNDSGTMSIGIRFNTGVVHVTYQGNIVRGCTTSVDNADAIQEKRFTCAASNITTVADIDVTALSNIILTPMNAAAATLMSGVNSLYVSARTDNTSFAVATFSGAAAAGTEVFEYTIIN